MAFLEVDGLSVSYAGKIPSLAVHDVSFTLARSDSLGLVGESGCGKSTLAMALLSLLPEQAERPAGSIMVDGVERIGMAAEDARRRRWVDLAYVPQNASTSLSPVHSLFRQFRQTWKAHRKPDDVHLRQRAQELFEAVELDPAWLDSFPHQLSGGMRQRAIIALSLLFNPSILIADEPTTGLDVIVQRQVIDVLKKLQAEKELALIFVSHDIAVVGELCRNLAVMYAGSIVEIGPVGNVMQRPLHPYSIALKQAFPDITRPERMTKSIPGRMPLLSEVSKACTFSPRCPFATDLCRSVAPELRDFGDQKVACHHAENALSMTRDIESGTAWHDIQEAI